MKIARHTEEFFTSSSPTRARVLLLSVLHILSDLLVSLGSQRGKNRFQLQRSACTAASWRSYFYFEAWGARARLAMSNCRGAVNDLWHSANESLHHLAFFQRFYYNFNRSARARARNIAEPDEIFSKIKMLIFLE